LVIEVNPAIADSHKYVSFSCQYGVQDNVTPKEFFVKLDTFINVRGKDMNVMNVTDHCWFLLRCENPPYSKSYYKDNLKVNKWKHLQFCDGRLSFAEGDGPGFESFRMRFF
jgi:hypothetical protein